MTYSKELEIQEVESYKDEALELGEAEILENQADILFEREKESKPVFIYKDVEYSTYEEAEAAVIEDNPVVLHNPDILDNFIQYIEEV